MTGAAGDHHDPLARGRGALGAGFRSGEDVGGREDARGEEPDRSPAAD
jgi:hypothetical protein